jgi:hypothetical protein
MLQRTYRRDPESGGRMRWNAIFAVTGRRLINTGYFLLILTAVAVIEHWWPLTVLAVLAWVGWLIPAAIWFTRRPSFQLLRRRPVGSDRPFGSPVRPARRRDDDPDR